MANLVGANDCASMLRSVLCSVSQQSKLYHYRLIGSTKDSLSVLLDIDELHLECILSLCGLWNIETKRYTIKDYRVFDSCQLIFTSMCCRQGSNVLKQKVHFARVGEKENDGITGPMKQYKLNKTSSNKKEHYHELVVLPPDIRLNRDERSIIDELKSKSSSIVGSLSRDVKYRRNAKPRDET